MASRASKNVAAELASIAYEHAIRGLDSQSAVLAEIRTRANYVIVATVAVATLFAGLLLKGSPPGRGVTIATFVPLAMLAWGVRSAVGVLRPTGKRGEPGELQFVASATQILGLTPATTTTARADVAEELEGMWDSNQVIVEGMLHQLRSATACLVGQVACWTILLGLKQVL